MTELCGTKSIAVDDLIGNDLLRLYILRDSGAQYLKTPTAFFSQDQSDWLEVLLKSPDLEVEVVGNDDGCPFCSSVNRMCGNGLPDLKLRSHSSTMEMFGLEEGRHTVSSLIEKFDDFARKNGQLSISYNGTSPTI